MEESEAAESLEDADKSSMLGPCACVLLLVLLLGGGGAAAYVALQPPKHLTWVQENREAALGTVTFRFALDDSDLVGPEIRSAPEITGRQLSGSAGINEFGWSALGQDHRHRVELEVGPEGEVLVLHDQGTLVRIQGNQTLLLQATGYQILEGDAASALFPVLGNLPIYLGLDLVNSAPKGTTAKNELGLPADNQVRVETVSPGSPAETVGLQAGDTILEAHTGEESITLESRQVFLTWLSKISPRNAIRLKIQRGQETFEKTVESRRRQINEFREGEPAASDDPRYQQWH